MNEIINNENEILDDLLTEQTPSEDTGDKIPSEEENVSSIPFVYHYDRKTGEFLCVSSADKDPVETELQGKFVAMVPAFATLTVPPIVEENQVAIFENGEWAIKPDFRKNYCKVSSDLEVSDITEIGEIEGFFIVAKEKGALIKENPNGYKILNGEIAEKTEEELKQEAAATRAEQFSKEFFNTSLGYIHRKVTMKDGSSKDFLTDIVPLLQVGVQIITYSLNGTELTQNTGVTVTEQFITECKQQLFNDFYGV